ncbi:hypothetical protein GBA52_012842 [Prunus armeniaca]|nr:hypothetical protein GBA52_012842 [Prunus armeniaca]
MFNSSNPLVHSLTPPLKLSSNLFFISVPKPSNLCTRALKPATANFSLSYSLESPSNQLSLAHSLQSETLEILEWASVCKQLSALAFTAMGFSAAQEAHIPVGRSKEESQKLLDQTTAAVDAITMAGSPPSDFSAIENVSDIVSSAVSGKLLSINELCAMRRTLNAAKGLFEKLKGLALSADCTDRYLPLLEILDDCDFLVELEKTIGLCIDCKLSIIVDTASEDLEIIRSERKSNMENLDSLLKEVSTQIFKAGGIDSPLVTKRRARMCVGVRATHKHLLPGCIVLDVSSSGATYFVEPKEAVELNNMEVRLSNAERAEEIGILSFLTSEIAKSETPIMYLLDKVLEVDLAFARAAYALRMNGVCPIFSSKDCQDLDSGGASLATSVDIEGLQHPLLLEPSLKNLSDVLESSSRNHLSSDDVNGLKMITGSLSGRASDFPVPIDIKIGCGTRVVVISGPNTGGKTASMKALGLASLMSKAGMYLPAKNHPKLPWFDLVLADIGDHQSLEQNLSTFSGHISRICNILEVASKESLVLIDEIGSGTDPSEGVALSASILLYLKGRVNLAVVTTHYADLSRLKEKDNQFENAAMEFCLETLQPTYRILWGSTGDSNALSIAKLIGFNQRIIERAQKWMERLMPEKQQERKGLLYRSLIEERGRLEAQAKMAASLHSDIMDLYREIQDEAEDLDKRKSALMAKETLQVQKEVKTAKSQMESVLNEFDNQLKTAGADQLNLLIRKSEAAIASVIKAHCPDDDLLVSETSTASYTPQPGEQVHLKRLGDKLATVVETPGDDGTVLVQYGKIKVRLKKNDIRAVPSIEKNPMTNSAPRLKQQASQSRTGETESGEVTYGPVIQTSKNTVDLRGMRVEEASDLLDMVISARRSQSVLFVIHGMGTGVVKERALEILKNHPRVAKYEQESPMNYGCTVAYIKFCWKMLAVFEKAIGKPPQELRLPSNVLEKAKTREEILETFQSSCPESTVYYLSNGNFMALSHADESIQSHPRSIVVIDDVFCIFIGILENTCDLRRHYGLPRQATEAMVVVEAYKVLRDRAPYPPDQVIKDLQGKFAFILFDARFGTLFAARDRDGSVELQWGMAGDGSLVYSHDLNIIREACGKSFAPFPAGCIFTSGSGLTSFVHPLHKVRAITHEDDDGYICGVTFQVDLFTRLPSIPRTGSAGNWADQAPVVKEGEGNWSDQATVVKEGE